ncbi:MAG: apolipoprotein N-acyltransferase [Alphaproteobacteria bacterium]|nr:apolipoprotein N-acyltransferase [Alphaproteobacteria bacterium]
MPAPPSSAPSLRLGLGLVALAGLCWGLAMPDLRGPPLLALGALLWARGLRGRPLHDALAAAIAGVTWAATALSSAHQALVDFGLPHPAAATALMILAEGLPWALVGAVAGYARRLGLAPAVALGLAWLACTEPLAQLQPFPVPPALLLAGVPWLAWPAAVGGTALLSGLAVAVGAGLPRGRALALLGVWAVQGLVWPEDPSGSPVEVGLVQPDLDPLDARRASTAQARADRLRGLVREAGGSLVLTPESSWPFRPGAEGSHHRTALRDAWAGLPPVLLGVEVREDEGATNSLVTVEDGQVTGRFDKHLRVPLTERALGDWGREAYRAGTTPRVLTLAGVRLGPLICYEDLFPGALREAVAEDVELLVAAAHDGWFRGGPGATWHLATARLAAISTGRWVMRPTTSGLSAAIDPWGRVRWSAPHVDGSAPEARGTAVRLVVRRRAPPLAGCTLALLWTAGGWAALAAVALQRRRATR